MEKYPWSYAENTMKMYKERQKKNKTHYNGWAVLTEETLYNLLYGERSNGKTYFVLELMIIDFCLNGNAGGLIRRWDTDFSGKNGQAMFANLVANGVVKDLTNGEWTDIKYESYRWYLCKYDDKLGKWIRNSEPLCYAFAINIAEHSKSVSFPTIKTVLFDEFITRRAYIPNEFVEFMNILSTIIRDRDNVRIFMCGNTVNKFCPYFAEMGLTDIDKMQIGTRRVYRFGETNTSVTVEYTDKPVKAKKSDIYFAFNNPKLKMITNGAWEIDIYPHLPCKYEEKNIRSIYFVEFQRTMLQCEVIQVGNKLFTYVHRKTSPLKYPDKERVYSPVYDPRPNWHRKLTASSDTYSRNAYHFYSQDRVYYADNEVGEIMRNYLLWCRTGE